MNLKKKSAKKSQLFEKKCFYTKTRRGLSDKPYFIKDLNVNTNASWNQTMNDIRVIFFVKYQQM